MTPHAPLIIDIAGTELTDIDRGRLAHPLTGGIILFGRNWKDREQLTTLCADVKSIRQDLLITVDHEGGRVQRFRTDGFTHLAPMRAFGEMWMKDAMAATNAATAAGFVLGAELRACGVDFSFTPVLDLDWSDDAPTGAQARPAPRGGPGSLGRPGASRSTVIGDRAFHRDARVAALLAKSLMQGLLRAGLANCGKHFPGHGFVRADSHTDIPVDTRSLEEILAEDAAPYRWLSTTLSSVMPAHVVYPKVDDKPAGFSNRWLDEILRGELGFQGAVISDDLSMAGARQVGGRELSFTDAAVLALNSGCDMVPLCNQSVQSEGGRAIDELLDGLAQALEEGRWQASEASEERRLALLPRGPALNWDALMAHPEYMHALDLLP
jgi:beta-N-acetylhexosaminidase